MTLDTGPFKLGPVGGAGPALLCLHGLTGTPYEVRAPAQAAVELGFACLGPLLPGHGGTWEELARTPHAEWVECVLAHYDQLASTHSRVYVMGLSLGGVLALRIAELRSVAAVLLLATPIDLGRWYRFAIPIVARLLPSVAKTPAIVDPIARERHPGLPRMPLRAVVELMRLQVDVEDDLDQIQAPLHLLYSRRDPTVSMEDAERIVRGAIATTGEIHYLDESGHVITVDVESGRVDRWVADTLLELEKAPG